MKEHLICPHCRRRFEADPDTARCPKCGMRSTADEYRIARLPPKLPPAGPGFLKSIWLGGPFASWASIAVTVALLVAVYVGITWAFRGGDRITVAVGTAEERLEDYEMRMEILGLSDAIHSYHVQDTTMTVAVQNEWHFMPYQLRYQAAQKLWQIWADVNMPLDPDIARIQITDASGNVIGGSRALGGSLVWVAE